MHDFDNNTKLDGLEILKALTHLLPYENVDNAETKIDTRGKTADEIRKEKRDRELAYYTGK
jgi:multiple coagulation factor deficiency protein 2